MERWAVAEREWLHYELYPGGPLKLDQVVRDVVRPAVIAATAAGPPQRWFFLRYADELGAHVRLRFGGPRGVVNEICRRVDPLLRRLLDGVARSPSPRPPTGAWPTQGGHPGPAGCYHGFYQPELDKYGGPVGVDIAEALFQASSRVVLAMLTDAEAAVSTGRRALALVLMREAVRSTVDAADAPAFWNAYESHWSGGPAQTARLESGYRRLARDRAASAEHRMTQLEVDSSVGPLVADYRAALRTCRADLLTAGVPVLPGQAAFQQVHLTNNRLGIPPAEEAYLARLLLEIDASPSSGHRLPGTAVVERRGDLRRQSG